MLQSAAIFLKICDSKNDQTAKRQNTLKGVEKGRESIK